MGKARHYTHGRTGTSEHKAWLRMKAVCYNENNREYRNNGGKGLTVCDRWLEKKSGFLNFLSDVGDKPEGKYYFARIDLNGGYEPSNCKWISGDELKERPRLYIPDGRSMVEIPVGTKVRMLTVIREVERDSKNKRRFEVRCDCGNITTVAYSNLINNTSGNTSCGCHRRTWKLVDIPIGSRYGRLVVKKVLETDLTIHYSKRRRRVEVECDCGTIKTVRYHDLYNHKIRSCGCFVHDWFSSDDMDYLSNYRRLYERHYGVVIGENNQIHHIDANRLNNDPSNLLEVTPEEHVWIHSKPELIGIDRKTLITKIREGYQK